MMSTTQLSTVFVEMADTLVDEYDTVAFLSDLTHHAAAISGAEAVGVMLADHRGQLQYLASSNETGKLLELLQLQVEEGPCIDCFRTSEPVVNADLASAGGRWPQFAPAAREAGFASVHAFPMRLRKVSLGALNLFGHPQTTFSDEELGVVQALADIATIAILQERNINNAEALTEQLQGALTSRVIIEQAKGALAQLQGISPDAAFQQLRARARSAQRRLTDVAAEVLESLVHRDPEA